MKLIVFSAAAAAFLASAALAQHSGHGTPAAGDSAATAAYKAVNARMHKDMDIRYSGDADADFVRGMIPHHQGAVEMAKIVLQHGKNPEIAKLAQAIVEAQQKEMTFMRGWLAAKGL